MIDKVLLQPGQVTHPGSIIATWIHMEFSQKINDATV